ncbi:MAG: MotA [Alphaproteobacteria bacterium]|nr:MotA [Alphaproteobacteria bacterium]HCP00340.1 MotA/TolQ/ExbB proton channel family protein [Rhodospirillaceae bacterium]
MPEAAKNALALIVSIIVVHIFYVGYVWPESTALIEASRAAAQSAPRNIVVILKDWEQEISIILMFWGLYLIFEKSLALLRERYLFNVDLLDGAEGKDMTATLATLEALPNKIRRAHLLRTLTASLRRFLITGDVHSTSETIEASVDALAQKQEAENSLIRYLIWAIPAIGFIGTVRGIGEALSQADQALAGDISGMTESLGVAFNSTFVALLISIVLMFLLHQLQRLQDGVLVDTQEYCESFLLNRIGVIRDPKAGSN